MISKNNESVGGNLKSVTVNRVSEITPSSGMDYFDSIIDKDHGFSEMASHTQ